MHAGSHAGKQAEDVQVGRQARQQTGRHAGKHTHTQQLAMYLPEGGHEAGDLPVVLTVQIRPMINQQLHHIQMTSCCHPSKGGGGGGGGGG